MASYKDTGTQTVISGPCECSHGSEGCHDRSLSDEIATFWEGTNQQFATVLETINLSHLSLSNQIRKSHIRALAKDTNVSGVTTPRTAQKQSRSIPSADPPVTPPSISMSSKNQYNSRGRDTTVTPPPNQPDSHSQHKPQHTYDDEDYAGIEALRDAHAEKRESGLFSSKIERRGQVLSRGDPNSTQATPGHEPDSESDSQSS